MGTWLVFPGAVQNRISGTYIFNPRNVFEKNACHLLHMEYYKQEFFIGKVKPEPNRTSLKILIA